MGLEQLSGEGLLFFGREGFVEFLASIFLHEIALGRRIFAGDAGQVSGNQLLTKEEGSICTFRQAVIANAKPGSVGKAAFSVEVDIALKAESAGAK